MPFRRYPMGPVTLAIVLRGHYQGARRGTLLFACQRHQLELPGRRRVFTDQQSAARDGHTLGFKRWADARHRFVARTSRRRPERWELQVVRYGFARGGCSDDDSSASGGASYGRSA